MTSGEAEEWLIDGGESGALLRSRDWSGTALGPRSAWPSPLRTALNLILGSRVPMSLLWGRGLHLLYNDAYRALVRQEEPQDFGGSVRELWRGVWHRCAPVITKVMQLGQTVCLPEDELHLIRSHAASLPACSLCFSPVRLEDGSVGGILVAIQAVAVRWTEGSKEEDELRKRTEQKLRAERELLSRLIEQLPVLITIYDPAEGSFRFNAECRRVLGWTDEDAITGNLLERAYPDPEVRRRVDEHMSGPGSTWSEFPVVSKEGRKIPILWANFRLTDRTQVGIGIDLRERKQAEAALRRSGARLEAALASMTDAVFIADAEGRLLQFNDAFATFHRFGSKEECAQRFGEHSNLLEVFLPDGGPAPADQWAIPRALRGETVTNAEYTLRRKDSGETWVGSYSFGPIRDEHRAIVGAVVVARDVTEVKRAEKALRRSEAKLRAVFHALTEGVVFLNSRGEVEETNEAVNRRHGHPLLELRESVHDASDRIIRPDGSTFPVDEQPALLALRSGQAVRDVEMGVPQANGDVRWQLVNAQPAYDDSGHLLGAVASFFDITDRKRAEQELREANARLLEADHRKNEFLAVLSHELRNPLTPIRNSVHIMSRAAPGGDEAQRALVVIDRQVTHMARLIDDLLDVSRISRGKIRLQREPLELNSILRGTGEDLRELFRKSGIELELAITERPVRAFADRTRIAQVVGNLLQNAAKFTPAGGHARLSLEVGPQGDAVIQVRDDGAGIEPELLDSLFQPFVQAHQTIDRSRGGLGLGLSLVKGLAELHEGTVTAFSEGPGKGSLFTLTLPTEAPGATPGTPSTHWRVERMPLRILIIEDNADAATSLQEVLELSGHQVDLAFTGTEGIQKACAAPPDAVLCDLGLPELDGFAVARELRKDPRLRSTLLVALSGYAQEEDVAQCLRAGFDQHLPKPPDLTALERLLARASPLHSAEGASLS